MAEKRTQKKLHICPRSRTPVALSLREADRVCALGSTAERAQILFELTRVS